jgi:sporulation protein YlmC with PRC-barrel domain
MAEMTQFAIGVEASCTDGDCGEVSRVVVDPIAQAVTHLVVEPKHRQGLGRLVPLDLIEVSAEGVRLNCTKAAFEKLDPAEETRFLPGNGGYEGYDAAQVLAWPYYGGNLSQPIVYETLPVGEVGVRRGEPVQATDGHIGQVQGLVIDGANHHVTHILLQEGHLWGRKEVAIPITAVSSVEDGIQLKISKHDVQELPTLQVDHPNA